MNTIKCPKCGKYFEIGQSSYDKIAKQIRDKEFNKEIELKEQLYKLDKNFLEEQIKTQIEKEFSLKLSKKDTEISILKEQLKSCEEMTKMEVKTSFLEELSKKENQINALVNTLELEQKEFLIKENSIKDSYEEKLKIKDEQIMYYKDFKSRLSTKMIGESLENHCSSEFNKLRSLFKNAYFEKDNDSKTGSKGDFIFRDYDDENNLIVSIMFEMKNEEDDTINKHKNEDFFKELDKDRKEKNCEYAVLVSLLENKSELYNTGIVDVSHKYDKMYVIRPQFFIPIITLIRNISLNTLEYKKQIKVMENQNIDITHFEENVNIFKDGFNRNYRIASEKFKKAIEEIDKTIDHLLKTKESLLSSENNLRLANNKAQDLSIKKLTSNSETVAKMFDELKEKC